MVSQMGKLKTTMDETFGKPGEAIKNIKELADSLAAIDQAKLKEIKSLMTLMGNVPLEGAQLGHIVEIVKMVCAVDIEKLKETRELIVSLNQLAKMLPKDLKDLPIDEILRAIKQE